MGKTHRMGDWTAYNASLLSEAGFSAGRGLTDSRFMPRDIFSVMAGFLAIIGFQARLRAIALQRGGAFRRLVTPAPGLFGTPVLRWPPGFGRNDGLFPQAARRAPPALGKKIGPPSRKVLGCATLRTAARPSREYLECFGGGRKITELFNSVIFSFLSAQLGLEWKRPNTSTFSEAPS